MAPIVVNLAYIALVSATMVRGILWLRGLLIAGASALVLYGALNGVKSVVIWNLIIAALHTRQLVIYIRSRRAVKLSAEEREFHHRFFGSLDEFDFFTLWSMGVDERCSDVYLARADQPQEAIYLLLEGNVDVQHDSRSITRLGPGALVGEISFISGHVANADAIAVGPVRVHKWNQMRLAALDQLNPSASRAMESFIGRDLAAKLS